jgi:nucleoside-diphosphate-sugar epimerase
LKALIARSADFYGTKNSILVELVVKNLDKGKKAMWFADAGKLHTFTSAEDAARATALLGNTPDAFNQVWHLPTSPEALTGEQWINLVARLMNKPARYTVVSKWMISALGLFVPIFREFAEMAYQYDRDYIFNSAKFEMRFGYTPQKPEEGIARLLTAVGIQ